MIQKTVELVDYCRFSNSRCMQVNFLNGHLKVCMKNQNREIRNFFRLYFSEVLRKKLSLTQFQFFLRTSFLWFILKIACKPLEYHLYFTGYYFAQRSLTDNLDTKSSINVVNWREFEHDFHMRHFERAYEWWKPMELAENKLLITVIIEINRVTTRECMIMRSMSSLIHVITETNKLISDSTHTEHEKWHISYKLKLDQLVVICCICAKSECLWIFPYCVPLTLLLF